MHKNLRNIRSCFKIFANLFIDYRFKVKFQLGSRKWTHDKKKSHVNRIFWENFGINCLDKGF